VIVFGVDDIYKEYERMKNLGVAFRRSRPEQDRGSKPFLKTRAET
jgi:hypothetical protein